MKDITLSIFFPAHNEEANITKTVMAAERVARRLVRDYEIIVIDDGSHDQTAALVNRLARVNSRVHLVSHPVNRGYGAALVSGFRAARHEYVFFSDADCQFNLEELGRLLAWVPEYPVVLGYRAPRRDPWPRLVNAWGWNRLNRWLFGLRVRDIDCAFKLFRRDLVAFLPLVSTGAMLSAEILIRLRQRGVEWREVAVSHYPRQAGVATGAKPAVILRALREMLALHQTEIGRPGWWEAGRFSVVGLINTAVDVVGYYLLTRSFSFFALHIAVSKTLSFFAGTVSSFLLNRQWTFAVRQRFSWAELGRFYAVVFSSLVINVAVTSLCVLVFGFYDLVAVVVATVMTFAWSFGWSRSWVFRSRASSRSVLALPVR